MSGTNKIRNAILRAALLGLVAAAGAAQAQSYRCSTPNGYRYSSTPCAGSRPQDDKMGSYGPSESSSYQPSYQRYGRVSSAGYRRVQDAPAYYDYLSPACKELNDAIRTASTRGVGGDAVRGLQREWSQRCSDDVGDAHVRMRQAQRDDRERKRAEVAEAQARQTSANVHREQCDEMLCILARKRKRTDLSDGERADLARFEANFEQRCH